MELKDQVCTLEQAKRLEELGINQDAYFSWVEDDVHGFIIRPLSPEVVKSNNKLFDINKQVYSAYTASELGEMLPCETGIIF